MSGELDHLPSPTAPDAPRPNRYQHEESVNRGRHTIHTGGKYDSHLLVPIVPPK
jgi:predicted acyl esterase